MEGFEQMKGFPRVIGAVDGCHIQIKTPQDAYHPMSYLNRKKDYSVILQVCFKKTKNHLKLKIKYTFSQRYFHFINQMFIFQAVCDHKLRFTDIVSGWPGSVHDARVFKNSELYSRSHQLFPGDMHILGDAAYPLHRYQNNIDVLLG